MHMQGRIDQVTDLETMDLVQFNNGVNPWAPNNTMSVGFKNGRGYLRGKVQDWGFQNLGRVVDVGSGYGRWSVFLAESNSELLGIERNEGGVEFTRRLSSFLDLDHAKYVACDVGKIPEESESVDGAWCNNVVQFVDRATLLTEINRVLKPGGILFLGVANSAGRVLEKFFHGYSIGGLQHRTTQFALKSLEQGPLFNGRASYTTPETIDETLLQFGFTQTEDYPLQATPRRKAPEDNPFSEELRDLSKLASRLLNDEKFAKEFSKYPDISNCFPLNVDVRAKKVKSIV